MLDQISDFRFSPTRTSSRDEYELDGEYYYYEKTCLIRKTPNNPEDKDRSHKNGWVVYMEGIQWSTSFLTL